MWFGKMIRALFRLVLKVLTLPVLLFVFVLKILAELLMNIGSFAIGLVMIVFVICLGMTIYQHLWSQTILVGLGAATFILMTFAASFVVLLLQDATSALAAFVRG